jgi:hypothetical protein
MTDIESNKGTEMWPSAQNIVRSPFPPGIIEGRIPNALKTPNLQLGAIDNLVHGASPRDVFVFYCMLRPRRYPASPP